MKRNVGHFGPEYLFIQVSEILYDINNLSDTILGMGHDDGD